MTPLTWTPLPGPQTSATTSEADIVGYGGAAGGGKSLLEIGLAVTQHRRSLIFRRESLQTRDLWDKLAAICGGIGRSNETLMLWRDLPGGRSVRLAGCKNEQDWRRFQGQGHDLFAFDEATEFSEYQVRTLIAWNRTDVVGQRCRVVLAFNPPTRPEGLWIVDFFGPWLDPGHPDPAEPGELRWYAVIDGKDVPRPDGEPFEWSGPHGPETIVPRSRTFFPARLADNPYLEQTGYRSQLQNLQEPLRSQLLYGDFGIGLQDDEWQVIPTDWIRRAQDRWSPGAAAGEALSAIGVDVAQGGDDNTVLVRRYGDWYSEPEVHPGRSVPDANVNAEHVLHALTGNDATAYIDADGIGSSTYHLVKAHVGDRAQSYLGSSTRVERERDASGLFAFFNVRSLAWWRLRESLDPSRGSQVALPPGRRILAELSAPRYEIAGRKLKLEKKADIIKRAGWSPDIGDAIVMASRQPSFGSRLAGAFRSQHEMATRR